MAGESQVGSTNGPGRQEPVGAIVLGILPLLGLAGGLIFLSRAHVWLYDQERYLRYAAYWNGNPSEVYSHWLDVLLMSGNAAALAWLLSLEAHLRRNSDRPRWSLRWKSI